MLYRVVCFGTLHDEDLTELTRTLAAIRPVVTSQLLGEWLASHEDWFSTDDASAAVVNRLAELPRELFADPELRRDPGRMVRAALPLMVGWQILQCEGSRYRLAAERRHPQFPFVEDIVAYQAAFLNETLAYADRAQRFAS
jgi:hypothetical protein